MEASLEGANGFFLLHVSSDIVGALALLGLLLAVVGVYGVVSYSATTRFREFGIRMALGAVQRDILAMLLREGLVLLWIGVLVGGTLAWAAARLMGSLLAGVSPHDPVALLVAARLTGH